MSRRQNYARPLLRWVRRRARKLQQAFGIDRREAVNEAALDYASFTGMGRRMASLIYDREVRRG